MFVVVFARACIIEMVVLATATGLKFPKTTRVVIFVTRTNANAGLGAKIKVVLI